MNRREFLRASAAGLAAAGLCNLTGAQPATAPSPEVKLPRWRGFNLLEKYMADNSGPYRESDFEIIAGWGFDFARLPMSYLCWTDPADWLAINDAALVDIDQAIEFGRRHNVHVNLNLHRAPGYCVNPPKEPLNLWTDAEALDAAAHHWGHLAARYKGIPSAALSFDLVNEPPDIKPTMYAAVVTRLVQAIRAEDPDRLIIADGLQYGRTPVQELLGLGVGQSARGYWPMQVSHYKANWMKDFGSMSWPVPTWPLALDEDDIWNKERLYIDQVAQWIAISNQGVGVHVGEWGAYFHTPHDVTLAWMKDWLELWQSAGFGWSLWNLRGDFGVLDSKRADVAYEPFKSHQLDRAMLELLKSH
jgi:endoglucanase